MTDTVAELLTLIEESVKGEVTSAKNDMVEGATSFELGRLEGLELAKDIIESAFYQYDAMCNRSEYSA